MKRITPFIVLAIVVLAAICVLQSRKLGRQEAQVVSLNRELEQRSKREEELPPKPAAPEIAEPDSAPIIATASNPPPPIETANPLPRIEDERDGGSTNTTGSQSKDGGGLGKLFSQMFKDPEMKGFLRQQQRMAVEQLYSPLVKQLGLTSEQSDKFKDLIADTMMQGSSMVFGEDQASRTNETIASLASAQTNMDSQLKALLGDQGYTQYQDYQLTVGERAQLNQFKQMMDGENALTDQQTDRLLAIIKEEKKNISASTGETYPGASPDQKTLQAMLFGDGLEKMLQTQEDVNQRVYQRANDILSPDQLSAFGKFQTNQVQMMRMGATMARKMFAPAADENATSEK